MGKWDTKALFSAEVLDMKGKMACGWLKKGDGKDYAIDEGCRYGRRDEFRLLESVLERSRQNGPGQFYEASHTLYHDPHLDKLGKIGK